MLETPVEMSTTAARTFSTAGDKCFKHQAQGAHQGQLEAISPLEVKIAQAKTAAASGVHEGREAGLQTAEEGHNFADHGGWGC